MGLDEAVAKAALGFVPELLDACEHLAKEYIGMHHEMRSYIPDADDALQAGDSDAFVEAIGKTLAPTLGLIGTLQKNMDMLDQRMMNTKLQNMLLGTIGGDEGRAN